jgi:hypothetical protein
LRYTFADGAVTAAACLDPPSATLPDITLRSKIDLYGWDAVILEE